MTNHTPTSATGFRAIRTAVLLLILNLVPQAWAAPVKFDIPAQPAVTAIQLFSHQADVEVLFPFDEMKAVQAGAVVGAMEPLVALRKLLAGTGYEASQTAPRNFVVAGKDRNRGRVAGTVVGPGSGAPLAGARLNIDGTAGLATTGPDGRFILNNVPAGRQTLVVRAEGFVPMKVTDVAVEAGESAELPAIALTAATPGEDVQQLEAIYVNAGDLAFGGRAIVLSLAKVIVMPSNFRLQDERGPVAATLTSTDLQALPQLGEDLYRAISHLPGLAVDDFSAKFWIRGAPHDRVLSRLDGVDLIEPFHLKDIGGSLSILDLETISHLDLTTGGFTSEYGNSLAGVLTMETDSHFRATRRTTVGLSLTGLTIATRGQAADGKSRWLLSGRSGYPDFAIKQQNDSDEVTSELKPRYYDLAGKWEMDLTPNHNLSIEALHAGDKMYFQDADGPVLNSSYNSDYFWARWRGGFGDRVKGEAVLSHTQLGWRRDGSGLNGGVFALDVHDKRELKLWGLRQDWTVSLTEHALLRGGAEFKSGEAEYDYHNFREFSVVNNDVLGVGSTGRTLQASPEGNMLGGYLAVRVQPRPGLTFEPGLRYDENSYAHDSDFSPRFNAAFTRGSTTVRAAWGYYYQAQGLHQLDVLDGDPVIHRAERAEHRVLSLEHRFNSGISFRAEAYERRVAHPRPHWENLTDPVDVFPEMGADRTRLAPVSQRARGVELIAERRGDGKFSWAASYAWARSEETLPGGLVIPRTRDQRHTIYLNATYTPNPRWQFSTAWQYHTGWPTTEGNFTLGTLANGSPVVGISLGTPFAVRLPSYQRLDLRLQRRFALKHSSLRLYLDVFNAYNRENAINYDYGLRVNNGQLVTTRRSGDLMFSILPSVGAMWDF